MYTPFVPQFYKMTTLDPRPRSSTRSTQELCDYGLDRMDFTYYLFFELSWTHLVFGWEGQRFHPNFLFGMKDDVRWDVWQFDTVRNINCGTHMSSTPAEPARSKCAPTSMGNISIRVDPNPYESQSKCGSIQVEIIPTPWTHIFFHSFLKLIAFFLPCLFMYEWAWNVSRACKIWSNQLLTVTP